MPILVHAGVIINQVSYSALTVASGKYSLVGQSPLRETDIDSASESGLSFPGPFSNTTASNSDSAMPAPFPDGATLRSQGVASTTTSGSVVVGGITSFFPHGPFEISPYPISLALAHTYLFQTQATVVENSFVTDANNEGNASAETSLTVEFEITSEPAYVGIAYFPSTQRQNVGASWDPLLTLTKNGTTVFTSDSFGSPPRIDLLQPGLYQLEMNTRGFSVSSTPINELVRFAIVVPEAGSLALMIVGGVVFSLGWMRSRLSQHKQSIGSKMREAK